MEFLPFTAVSSFVTQVAVTSSVFNKGVGTLNIMLWLFSIYEEFTDLGGKASVFDLWKALYIMWNNY